MRNALLFFYWIWLFSSGNITDLMSGLVGISRGGKYRAGNTGIDRYLPPLILAQKAGNTGKYWEIPGNTGKYLFFQCFGH